MKKILFIIFFSLLISLWGEEPIPDSYRDIKLGMSRSEVETLLAEDPYFLFRPGIRTSLREEESRDIIECEGTEFISQAYFHFDNGALVLFTLNLNRNKIDYFTLLNDFSLKWGEPHTFSSTEGVWENETYRVSLIKPLSIRYSDIGFTNRISGEKTDNKNYFEERREAFLEDF